MSFHSQDWYWKPLRLELSFTSIFFHEYELLVTKVYEICESFRIQFIYTKQCIHDPVLVIRKFNLYSDTCHLINQLNNDISQYHNHYNNDEIGIGQTGV